MTNFTDPEVIFLQYQFGFQITADQDLNAVSVAATSVGSAPSPGVGDTGGGGGSFPCFIGETPILMWDRTWMPIEKIEVGMWVASFDTKGAVHRGLVLDVPKHFVHECLDAQFADGRRTGVTKEHPYWVGNNVFRAIGSLNVVLTFGDGDIWQPNDIKAKPTIYFENGIWVYNLEIARWQTYIANGDGVHNLKRNQDEEFRQV